MNAHITIHFSSQVVAHRRLRAFDVGEKFEIAAFQHRQAIGRTLGDDRTGFRVTIAMDRIRRQRETEAAERSADVIQIGDVPADVIEEYLAAGRELSGSLGQRLIDPLETARG